MIKLQILDKERIRKLQVDTINKLQLPIQEYKK